MANGDVRLCEAGHEMTGAATGVGVGVGVTGVSAQPRASTLTRSAKLKRAA